jgi:hypothetical protein
MLKWIYISGSSFDEPMEDNNLCLTHLQTGGEVPMPSYFKVFVLILLAAALTISPLPALSANNSDIERNRLANPPDPGVIIVDLVAVRPVGIVATLVGSAVFLVAMPFALLGGNTEDVFESLVVDPATFTFKRPLGEFKQ